MRAAIAVALVTSACGSHTALCIEGQSSPCACATGASGAQTCAHGTFGPCTCIEAKPRGTFEATFKVTPGEIQATVIGAGKLPLEAFTLVDRSTGLTVKPTKLVGGREGPEPIALAVVMNGWEMWVGNDKEIAELREDDPSRYPGVLIDMRQAFDRLELKQYAPAASVGMLIIYDDRATIRVPMGPLSQLTGNKLGSQRDYFGKTGVESVIGVELALAELHKRPEPRKALILIGDGNDTNNDAARKQFADLKKRAATDNVQTLAIVYKARLSGEANVFPVFTKQAVSVTSAVAIERTIAEFMAKLDDRVYLTFPGHDPKTRSGLHWDGRRHDLVIETEKHASDPWAVTLPQWSPPAR